MMGLFLAAVVLLLALIVVYVTLLLAEWADPECRRRRK